MTGTALDLIQRKQALCTKMPWITLKWSKCNHIFSIIRYHRAGQYIVFMGEDSYAHKHTFMLIRTMKYHLFVNWWEKFVFINFYSIKDAVSLFYKLYQSFFTSWQKQRPKQPLLDNYLFSFLLKMADRCILKHFQHFHTLRLFNFSLLLSNGVIDNEYRYCNL